MIHTFNGRFEIALEILQDVHHEASYNARLDEQCYAESGMIVNSDK
jgi:hypothetical protein